MINPKELRIGNLVKCDGKIRSVYQIGNGIITLNPIEGTTFDVCQDSGLKPIPLTHEILEKAGFELFPWGFVKNDVLIRVHYDGHGTPKYWLEVGNGLRVYLQSVHQLQNLFHALTGEELEIKL